LERRRLWLWGEGEKGRRRKIACGPEFRGALIGPGRKSCIVEKGSEEKARKSPSKVGAVGFS